MSAYVNTTTWQYPGLPITHCWPAHTGLQTCGRPDQDSNLTSHTSHTGAPPLTNRAATSQIAGHSPTTSLLMRGVRYLALYYQTPLRFNNPKSSQPGQIENENVHPTLPARQPCPSSWWNTRPA